MPQRIPLRGKNLSTTIVATCSFGFALVGYDSGVFGGLTTDPRFLKQFGEPNAALLGFIVSIFTLGSLAGALFMASFGERWGRRNVMMAGFAISVVGAALQSSAFTLAHILVGRVVSGIAVGFFTSAMPVWQAECLHVSRRGISQCINLTTLIGLGINVAYWLDYGMYYVNTSASWRIPLAFQIIYAVVAGVGVLLLPESPRWLMAHGREEEAREVMHALRDGTQTQEETSLELEDIKTAIAIETAAGHASWSELLTNKPGVQAFHRVWVGMASQAMQEFSGANAIIYYASYIFTNSLGLGRKDSLLVSGGLQIFFFFMSFIPWYFIDRAGRRILFIAGAAGMTCCLIVSAGCVAYTGHLATGVVAAIALYLFQAFFTLGWMANLWLYSPELLPLRHRARGNALATSSQWITTFLIVEITPPAITSLGYGIYILFAGFNLLAIPIIWYCFPETAGKNLEEIDLFFQEPTLRKAVKESLRRRKLGNEHIAIVAETQVGEVRVQESKLE